MFQTLPVFSFSFPFFFPLEAGAYVKGYICFKFILLVSSQVIVQTPACPGYKIWPLLKTFPGSPILTGPSHQQFLLAFLMVLAHMWD